MRKDVIAWASCRVPRKAPQCGTIPSHWKRIRIDSLLVVPLETQDSSRTRHELRRSIGVYLMGPHLKAKGYRAVL